LLRASAIQNGPADVEDLPEFEDIDEQTATDPGYDAVTADNTQQIDAIQNGDATVTLADVSSVPNSKKIAGDPQ
jgi:hypothetical protein